MRNADSEPSEPTGVRRITVPASVDMVNVLGPRDEFLGILERELSADVHVRGNEVTFTGDPGDVIVASEVLTELITIVRTGQGLTADAVERVVGMTAQQAETLRPLYDALHDMVDPESVPRLLTAGTIEVAPLAYMRGRSLNDAFIILDEAQNTSMEQMKMFLTRLGFGSKIVVTGDVTQIDLPTGTRSGLQMVQGILDGVDDIAFCRLTNHDVVRHKLVGRIVAAYDRFESTQQPSPEKRRERR